MTLIIICIIVMALIISTLTVPSTIYDFLKIFLFSLLLLSILTTVIILQEVLI